MNHDYWAQKDNNFYILHALSAKDKNNYYHEWHKTLDPYLPFPLKIFALIPDTEIVAKLPRYSFMFKIPFKLKKPYLCKDEQDFYLLDNPIRRDKVFKTPLVSSTSWKGSLHAAMLQQAALSWNGLSETEKKDHNNGKAFVTKRIQLARMFGTERGVTTDENCRINLPQIAGYNNLNDLLDQNGDEYLSAWYRCYIKWQISKNGFFAGRLHFYPTFFDNPGKVALEVINPHNRKTGSGERGPILMECVPENESGEFIVLYVPFGDTFQDDTELKYQVISDLTLLADGLHAMFLTYGFGAKTSSGFGITHSQLSGNGKLVIHAKADNSFTDIAITEKEQAPLPYYLEAPNRLRSDLLNANDNIKSEEEFETYTKKCGRKYTKNDKLLYNKALKWWERQKNVLPESVNTSINIPSKPKKANPLTEFLFDNLETIESEIQKATYQLLDKSQA